MEQDFPHNPVFDRTVLVWGIAGILLVYSGLAAYSMAQGRSVLEGRFDKLAFKEVAVAFKADNITEALPEASLSESDKSASIPEGTASEEAAIAENIIEQAPAEPPHGTTAPELPKQDLRDPAADANKSAFQKYKRAYSPSGKPAIILAVDDFGLSENESNIVLETLPAEASLLLSPYAPAPARWEAAARKKGNEIWVVLPAESTDYPRVDPGPQALLSQSSVEYNQQRLNWALGRGKEYAGIAASLDSSFDKARPVVQTLMESAFRKGLGYYEINPFGVEFLETLALSQNYPYAQSSLSAASSQQSLQDLLVKTEAIAKETGYAVLHFKPYPAATETIAGWARSLRDRGFDLAPVSAVADGTLRPKG